MKLKKGKLLLFFTLLTSLLLFHYGGFVLAADLPLRSFYKTDFRPEDTYKGLDPNVLFLLDTSTAMTFSVNGVMPSADDGRSLQRRAELLKENTYGHGMRPPQFNGVETTMINGGAGSSPSESYSRYGRDLDPSNNVIGSADCYYTSDPAKPYLLTFRNRFLAHYTGWPTPPLDKSYLPRGGVVGSYTDEELEEAISVYKEIAPYMPGGIHDGKPVPEELVKHLVPNDSRLYKMKLALWRLTERQNASVFSRMNVGIAITYQDISTSRNAASMATKNASSNAIGFRDYYGATDIFENGNAPPYITGEPNITLDRGGISTDYSYMSQRAKRGVLVDLYQRQKPGQDFWNAISRAIMYVPFDKFYVTESDGSIKETSKLKYFRKYISGYENYTPVYYDNGNIAGAETKPLKDEFWASSLTLLSTAIYGGRISSEGGDFPYHKGKLISDTSLGLSPTNQPLIQFAVTPKDNAGSTRENVIFLETSKDLDGYNAGQAVGSVLDFFSPPDTTNATNGFDGVKFGDDTVGFFPVTGSCQANWLVVFCSGYDAVPGYSPAQAVKKLFNNTLTMRGRRWTGSKWVLSQDFAMDSGVRTIVVGFIDPKSKEQEVQKIYNDLKTMAEEGDPILDATGKYVANPYAKPEIANDASGLVNAFSNVLRRINAERMGSGTVSVRPVIDNITDPDSRVVFGAAYKINPLDQWTGLLGKYIIQENNSVKQWEANEKMISRGLDRDVFTFTGIQGSFSGSVENISELPNYSFEALAGIPTGYATEFKEWLTGYRHKLENGDEDDSAGVLGDMINSGITVVGKPKNKSLISDTNVNNRDAVVYVQTNRGVLHAVHYLNGNEIWGFIPPNVFQHKLKNMKYDGNNWINGNGYTRARSNPMVLLDGMIIARDIEYKSINPKTLLTGYLGNGGNGFYTMDITNMDSSRKKPVFEWAIENARYDEAGSVTPAESVKRWGKAAEGSIDNYNYSDLGFTIVPGVYFIPANGDTNTIGVLPGGLGYKLGESGDTQGKAFYFFNPLNGSIIRKIDSNSNASTGFIAPYGKSLGMGVSPIIYHENGAKRAIELYTADSEGNILLCDMEGVSESNWKLKSILQFRTLGSSFPYEGTIPNPPVGGLPVVIPRKMILAKAKSGHKWLFGGTSNLDAPGSDAIDFRKIANGEQFIFGFNVSNVNKSSEVNTGINPADAISNGKMRNLKYYIDGIPGEYGNYGQGYTYDDETGVSYGMTDYGWVLRLRPRFGVTDTEYLSADPYLQNNVLYFATFIPNINTNSEEACRRIGVAKLYAFDPSTGRSVMEDKSAVVLENIKISGISGNPSKNTLILSVKELDTGTAGNEMNKNFKNVLDITSSGSLYEVDAPGGSPFDPTAESNLNFQELVPTPQYWSERF